jgi:hypothetical protein
LAAVLRLTAAVALLAADLAIAEGLFGSVGVEVDEESGYLLLGAVGGSLAEHTSWDLAGAHADTSRNFSSLTTTAYDAGIYHDFGDVGLRFGLGGWRDSDLVATQRLAAALDFHGEAWSVALQSELRASDFEPFAINRTIVRRDGTTVTITAQANCEIEDVGIGARLRLSGGPWTFAVSGMSYDYDDAACDFDLAVLDFLRRSTREEFVQFADRITALLSIGAGSRLLAETSFLDSRVGTSLTYTGPKRAYSAYYDHLEEAFFGLESDTLSGGVAFTLDSGNEIEVYVGATDGEELATVGFLGFYMLFAP